MKPKITKGWIEVLWSVLLIIVFVLFSTTGSFASNPCPEETWNRNQYTGPGGGMYTGPGGGMYTGPGGGMYTGPGGGMYTGPGGGMYTGSGRPYCTKRPHLFILRELGK
jgi:hypothetical protein